jgi:hypothetical protein
MATNREMLKEAIAEAKAVKEMAIANAKVALEETFTPQLKSMLSLKLQEMEMEDEELDEAGFGKMKANSEIGFSSMGEKALDEEEMEEGEGENMYEVDLEELLAELELEEEEEPLYEAEEGEEEEEEEESEDTEMEDLSDDEIKSMIEDVISQMIADKELEAGPEFEAEEDEEMEMSDEDEEEVDLAELLKEIEEMEEAENSGVPSAEEIKAAANKLKAAADSGELSQEDLASLESAADAVDVNAINEAEGENLKAEFQAEVEKLKKDRKVLNVAQKIGIGVASLSFALLAYGISQDADAAATARAFDMLNINPSVVAGIIGSIGGVLGTLGITGKKYSAGQQIKGKEYQMSKMEEDLSEALSTIKTLKSELNEINLLNAKLLYSNKIFKAKNLNESQKVKVLSSFDKAKNVSEVKIVFETLNEGIKTAKSTIKENLGRASKSTNTPTTTKQPIVESNDVFKRMQKLAGLI